MYQSKPRYDILDGLRGVAALTILCYHLFEAIAFAAGAPEQDMYHGFLAVDFFFVLSGFVMGYAYDERWNVMSFTGFVKRRLIRLHPMVVMGVVIGLVAFCVQGRVDWNGHQVATSALMLTTLLALFLLPVSGSLDVRGNTEMFPLNGPHWSLFFEYIGSLLYGLILHKVSTRVLKVWVTVAAALLLLNGILSPDHFIAYGWSSEPMNIFGGLLRLTFGYPMGLLLARLFRKKNPKPLSFPVFPVCALALLLLFVVPSLGAASLYYQVFCVVVAFPLIVWVGARGTIHGSVKVTAQFLGRLSYPLYAIHYPFIYLYISWINNKVYPFGPQEWATPVALFFICIAVGIVIMKYYDEPVRKWLSARCLK